MPNIDFSFVVHDEAAQDLLSFFMRKVRVPSELMEQIRDRLVENVENNFNTEADPDGSPWAELAPSTVRQKRLRGLDTRKLRATGKGKQSIKVTVVGESVEVSYDEHMVHHQHGTRKMPQRKFAPDDRNVETGKLGDVLQADVEEYLSDQAGIADAIRARRKQPKWVKGKGRVKG